MKSYCFTIITQKFSYQPTTYHKVTVQADNAAAAKAKAVQDFSGFNIIRIVRNTLDLSQI